MPKRIELEGTIHEFPDDFTDADIQAALAAAPRANPPMARTEDFTQAPEKGPATGSAFKRFAERLLPSMTPSDYLKGPAFVIQHPIESAKVLGEAIASDPIGAIPVIGNIKRGGEAIREGNYAGALGEAAAGAIMAKPAVRPGVRGLSRVESAVGRGLEAHPQLASALAGTAGVAAGTAADVGLGTGAGLGTAGYFATRALVPASKVRAFGRRLQQSGAERYAKYGGSPEFASALAPAGAVEEGLTGRIPRAPLGAVEEVGAALRKEPRIVPKAGSRGATPTRSGLSEPGELTEAGKPPVSAAQYDALQVGPQSRVINVPPEWAGARLRKGGQPETLESALSSAVEGAGTPEPPSVSSIRPETTITPSGRPGLTQADYDLLVGTIGRHEAGAPLSDYAPLPTAPAPRAAAPTPRKPGSLMEALGTQTEPAATTLEALRTELGARRTAQVAGRHGIELPGGTTAERTGAVRRQVGDVAGILPQKAQRAYDVQLADLEKMHPAEAEALAQSLYETASKNQAQFNYLRPLLRKLGFDWAK